MSKALVEASNLSSKFAMRGVRVSLSRDQLFILFARGILHVRWADGNNFDPQLLFGQSHTLDKTDSPMFAGNIKSGSKVSVETSYGGRYDHDASLCLALERTDFNPSEFNRVA